MKKLTTEEFIAKAKAIHGDCYDYAEVEYVKSTEAVRIICKKHGVFLQAPFNHLKGHGCSKCTKSENRRLGIDVFIKRANAIHNNFYDYSKSEYVNSVTPVCIICPIHGEFQQTPNKHLSGQGCPKCAPNYKDTTASFIEKAKRVHGDFYDYSKVDYVDEHTKVCIIDPEYGEFWQQPCSHLNGRGNPVRKAEKTWKTKRAKGMGYSTENKIYDLLVAKFGKDNVAVEYWSEKYPFPCDFYIKSFDLYIELNVFVQHGGHWFNPLSKDDVTKLAELTEKSKTSSWAKRFIKIWAENDLLKKRTAEINDINYLVFWKQDLSDFMKWYNLFDFNNPVLKQF